MSDQEYTGVNRWLVMLWNITFFLLLLRIVLLLFDIRDRLPKIP